MPKSNIPVRGTIYTYAQIGALELTDMPFLRFKGKDGKIEVIQEEDSFQYGTDFDKTTWVYERTTHELCPLFNATPETNDIIYNFVEHRKEDNDVEDLVYPKREYVG